MAGYDNTDAGVQMTLAAIAYAGDAESTDLPEITKAIDAELHNANYATRGAWTRVWGPVLSHDGNNVLYVAKRDAGTYSIVLRGTTMSVRSFWEDIPTGQSSFAQVTGDPTHVDSHFLDALNQLVGCSYEGQGLGAFLVAASGATRDLRVFVTGHSQGGGLTPMFVAWALRHRSLWTNPGRKEVVGYAFAPPTSGSPDFANWISANATCFQVINPRDVVPHGYASIGDIISRGIPCRVPLEYEPLIWAFEAAAKATGPWQQPQTLHILPAVNLPSTVSYLDQVEGQHNKNTYLALLGAPQTCLDGPSPLPGYPPPTYCGSTDAS